MRRSLRRALVMMVALPLALGLIMESPAGAADPPSGRLDPKNKVVEWDGPVSVVAANPIQESVVAGTLQWATGWSPCSGGPAPLACDTFVLAVDVPEASYRIGGGVRVRITWGSGINRYTLDVRDEEGKHIASAGGLTVGSVTEEEVFIPSASGTYMIEVGALLVVNDQHHGIAELQGLKKVGRGR